MNKGLSVSPFYFAKGASYARRPCGLGAETQKFIKMFPVYHPNISIFYWNIDRTSCWRYHTRCTDPRNQLFVRDYKIGNKSWWNSPTAGFNPPVSIQKSNFMPASREILCGRRARGSTTNNNNIKHFYSPGTSLTDTGRVETIRRAIVDEAINRAASNKNTVP